MRKYVVYLIYVDGVIRYVGMSSNPVKRLANHPFIRKIRKPVKTKIFRQGLTRSEARTLEEQLFVKFRGQLMAGDLTYSERARRAAEGFWQKPNAIEEKRESQRVGMKRAMKN